MEHTVGVVTDLKTERIYRNRKVRYKHTARIEYKTKRYSSHVRMQLYNPFIFQGSEISLWYYPDRTEEVVIPFEEGFIWGEYVDIWYILSFFRHSNYKSSKK